MASAYSECDYCHRLYPKNLMRQRANGKKMCVECVGDQPADDEPAELERASGE
jgi:hypothetical protein